MGTAIRTAIGGTAGAYAYNGGGLRTTRTIGGAGVSYVWNQNAGMPVILQDSAGNRYVYGLDLISRTGSLGNQEYELSDGLGSTTGLADGTGAVTDTYAYDVYGAVRARTGTSTNEFTFTGEQVDATGLQYLRARYYDAATGRFVSRDPLPLLQQYAYVHNNPTNLVDPSGLCAFGLPCPDPRQLADPLIERLPEGRIRHLPFDVHVSYQLAATCVQYPEACEAGASATAVALAWTRYYYGAFETREGTRERPKEGDAFTHCYWSGLTTLQVGASKAKRVTTRFEAYGSSNNPAERQYDMDNNTRGREFAHQYQALGVAAEPALRDYCRG